MSRISTKSPAIGKDAVRKERLPKGALQKYSIDNQVGFLMRVAMQRHTAIFMSKMVEGLTPTQYSVLAKLYEVGPSSQNRLGRLVFLDSATIKGVIDRLGVRGYVTTEVDPSHRRRLAISLTPQGVRVTEEGIRLSMEITARTLKPLKVDDQRSIARLLKKLM